MSSKTAGISDEAVRAKTGKNWQEWFALLDSVNASEMSHKEIARYLYEKQDVPGWWAQMVTVGYEQARGLRQKNQSCDGDFQVGCSKTISVPLSALYEAWQDERQRRAWLADPDFTVRKATQDKSMRITWVDGRSSVSVYFYAKGENKSQVVVDHTKLADQEEVEVKRAYWAHNLGQLKQLLESQHAQ
ncbi:MAG: hypothetical protein D6743_12730 [Calditrichaeota bacterium]|nr:MAG: hypothetical protein D6743_12730 [Calditrichota bacterium]